MYDKLSSDIETPISVKTETWCDKQKELAKKTESFTSSVQFWRLGEKVDILCNDSLDLRPKLANSHMLL